MYRATNISNMKNRITKWMARGLVGAVLTFAAPYTMPEAMAEDSQTESGQEQMIEREYEDIGRDFFSGNSKKESVQAALVDMGIAFPEGASVKYTATSKKLVMVNYREDHEMLQELIKAYKGDTQERAIAFIEQCNIVSGKVDKKAQVYIIITFDESIVDTAKDAGYNLAEIWACPVAEGKKQLKLLQKLQKIRGTETLIYLEDKKLAEGGKKLAKVLKIRGPILVLDDKAERSDSALPLPGGESIGIYDRRGNEIYEGSLMDLQLDDSTLKTVTDKVKELREEQK